MKRLEDSDREAAQAGNVFWTEVGADAATILIVVSVDDVMNAFDTPMPAVDGHYALQRALSRGAPRDFQSEIMRALAGFFVEGIAFDPKGLSDVEEVEVSVERRAAPNALRLDTSPRQNQEATVVGDQFESPILRAKVQADPEITNPTFEYRRRKTHLCNPLQLTPGRDIPCRLSNLRQRLKVVVPLHLLLLLHFVG